MSDNADYFIEMECCQIVKHGQNACGDAFDLLRLDDENRAIAVLSDGLGSGIKASVLATMTVRMAMRFLRTDMDLLQSVENIMDALPVDSVRRISYATFSMIDLQVDGKTRLVEMGNPQYIHLRGTAEIAAKEHSQMISPRWPDRPVECYELDLRPGDRIICCSDGVTQSGLENRSFKFGWRRDGELAFIRELVQANPTISAYDLAHAVAHRALAVDSNVNKDDISCMVVYLRRPRVLRILTGPPYHKSNDATYARLAAPGTGADSVIVCGGTSANIIQRELGVRIQIDLKKIREAGDLPPPGNIPGIGIATEGILTLSRVRRALEEGDLDGNPLPMAAQNIIDRMKTADRIEFCVGTKINDAHQDPNLPAELDLRRNVIHRMADLLKEKYRKQTILRWF